MNNKGITLVELMIGASLLVVAGILANQLFTKSIFLQKKASDQTLNKVDQLALTKFAKDKIPSSNIKFFSYTGADLKDPAGVGLVRTIIPMTSKCFDLSTASCEDDVGLLFVDYNFNRYPMASIICRLNESGDNPDWLIDLNNNNYGQGTYNTSKKEIRIDDISALKLFPTGGIKLAENQLIAMISPPNGYLWIVKEPPTSYSIGPEFPAECNSRLQRNADGTYKTNELYRIKLNPVILDKFVTEETILKPKDFVFPSTMLPVRLANVKLMTIGKVIDGDKANIGTSNCETTLDGAYTSLNCVKTKDYFYDIKRMRIDQKFKISLIDGTVPRSSEKWYEISSTSLTNPSTCTDSSSACATLPINNLADIPTFVSNEKANYLQSGKFSLIKQEELDQTRIRVLTNEKPKEYEIIVFYK